MLRIEKLTKSFNDKKILDDVSLSVGSGEVAVLLGASGVGKSTLLRILNNLETANSGNIFLDGKKLDIAQVNRKHTIGMVFQQFNLFEHLTVEENITLPLQLTGHKSQREAQKIAADLLAHYGLTDKKTKYSSQLSGGQKQRLAIARAIAMKPKIICLDEPTSALDPVLTSHVAQNIQQLAKEGYIVLVASHDTSLLESLDCVIYLMSNGKIVEEALSDNFKKNKDDFSLIKKFVAGQV